jgi:hypothetical protein
VVGHTRVLPQLLADTRKLLAEAWPRTERNLPGAGIGGYLGGQM